MNAVMPVILTDGNAAHSPCANQPPHRSTVKQKMPSTVSGRPSTCPSNSGSACATIERPLGKTRDIAVAPGKTHLFAGSAKSLSFHHFGRGHTVRTIPQRALASNSLPSTPVKNGTRCEEGHPHAHCYSSTFQSDSRAAPPIASSSHKGRRLSRSAVRSGFADLRRSLDKCRGRGNTLVVLQ